MNEWFLLTLMSLSAYRLTRLVVKDDFPPILWVRDHLVGGWREMTESERQSPGDWVAATDEESGEPLRKTERARWVPAWLAALLSCSWCASGWLSLGIVLGADVWLSVPTPVFMWGAVWALSALLAAQDWT